MIGRRAALAVAAFAVLTSVPAHAQSQDFPNRPVRIVVPTAPGGMSDIVSRTFAAKVQERTGKVVVVENRTGANGVLAADYVAKSAPDGYTIYLGFHGTNSVLQHLDAKLPYNPEKDFASVVFLVTGPTVLVVHPSVPAKTIKELIELAKTKPGGLSYASAGIGTTPHLVAEQFKLYTGVNITGVQYRGAAPANQDVLAGHVPMTFDLTGNAMNNIKEGKFRALCAAALAAAARRAHHAGGGAASDGSGRMVRVLRPGRHAARRDRLAQPGGQRDLRGARRQRALHQRRDDAAARYAGGSRQARQCGQQALERGDPQGRHQAGAVARDGAPTRGAAQKKAGPSCDGPAFCLCAVYCLPASNGVMRRTVTRRFSSLGPWTGTLSWVSP
jgi:tripartite-type tricarboxylate transporter receptor subunit TctC